MSKSVLPDASYMGRSKRFQSGFSLVELVIVVVILGVIGAVAMPRISRGATGAGCSTLCSDLSIMRRAIEMYRAEHCGLAPTDDSTFANQMLLYTDVLGNTSVTKTGTYMFGPYLRAIPPLPVGDNAGSNAITDNGVPGTGPKGWFYDKDAGDIFANTKPIEVDASGVAYSAY